MKRFFAIFPRFRVAMGLLIIMAALLATNRFDDSRNEQISDSVQAIYHDRLWAEKYLFHIQHLVYEGLDVLRDEPDQTIRTAHWAAMMAEMDTLESAYFDTRMTSEELILIQALLVDIRALNAHVPSADLDELSCLTLEINDGLQQLSELQVTLAGTEWKNIRSLMTSASLFSYLELALLLVIGLIIQALIYASKPIWKSLRPTDAQSN
jgi:hypothetical protein